MFYNVFGYGVVFYGFETLKQKIMSTEKDLNYWKANAEEDYKQVPISVLRYITELETAVKNCSIPDVSDSFEVFSYSTFDKNRQWCHWSEGLTLVMKQGKNTIKVKGDDCIKITNALPRTFGSSY